MLSGPKTRFVRYLRLWQELHYEAKKAFLSPENALIGMVKYLIRRTAVFTYRALFDLKNIDIGHKNRIETDIYIL